MTLWEGCCSDASVVFGPQSQNIFITANGIIKLGDFGIASTQIGTSRPTTSYGMYGLPYRVLSFAGTYAQPLHCAAVCMISGF
jgi:serine/threonine protein kinase